MDFGPSVSERAGVTNLVVDSTSIEVLRRARRAKRPGRWIMRATEVSVSLRILDAMRLPVAVAALATAAVLAAAAPAGAQQPDTILVNGKILSVDPAFSTHEALAIREGRIMAVGRSADIRRLAGPGTRTIDLNRRTV